MTAPEANGSKSRTDLSGRELSIRPTETRKSPARTRRKGTSGDTRASRAAKPILGWREWVTFPEVVPAQAIDGAGGTHPGDDTASHPIEGPNTPIRIKAKVDTGARTSTLHAFGLRRIERDGKSFARFDIHPIQRSARESVTVEYEIHDERPVRSSRGKAQVRPVVLMPVQIGDTRMDIELTLTQRDEMGFRMLLGRQAIRPKFLVDPSASFLAGRGTTKSRRSRSATRMGRSLPPNDQPV